MRTSPRSHGQLLAEPGPEYRDVFDYINNYPARLRGRDRCINKSKRWRAISCPKAPVWPHLRESTRWCQVRESLPSEVAWEEELRCPGRSSCLLDIQVNLSQTLKSKVCDSSKGCCPFLRFPSVWPTIASPIFDSCLHTLAVSFFFSVCMFFVCFLFLFLFTYKDVYWNLGGHGNFF